MVDKLSSGMIGAFATISIGAHLALVLQILEEVKVHNLEEKEQMIMRYGKLATMIQQQEEEKAQKLMKKNSRPWHQRRQGRLCFSFSVSFTCTIFFGLTYPSKCASPQN